jgi:hypothetical protein
MIKSSQFNQALKQPFFRGTIIAYSPWPTLPGDIHVVKFLEQTVSQLVVFRMHFAVRRTDYD